MHHSITLSRRTVAFAIVVALGASLALIPTSPAGAATRTLRVIAVGDSYASGEGAIGSGWTNAFCHRSSLAAPQNAAGQLATLRPVSFSSLACSGSITGSAIGAGATAPSGPKTLLGGSGQLAGVGLPGERIDGLTMSIGGNDLGFAGIVAACMDPFSDCSTNPAVTGPLGAAFGSLPARLDAVAAAVQGSGKITPGTVQNVFVTEYPDPTTGPWGARCGSPLAPAFQGLDGVSAAEATFASAALVAPLNAALAGMVSRANAAPGTHPVWHFVTGISARYVTHGYCTGGGSPAIHAWFVPRYISTPVDSATSQGDAMGTMHPNDLGQRESGAAMFGAMRFLTDSLSVQVASSATPIIGVPVNLDVTVRTSAGTAAVGASVTVDGVVRGVTDQAGRLTTTESFATTGSHVVSADLDPYPVSNGSIQVIGKTYTATSTPNPIPVGSTISSLTVTAVDEAGGTIPGTFMFEAPNVTTITVQSGVAKANVLIKKGWDWEIGPDDKPVKMLVCPTLSFVPDNQSIFDPGDFSDLVNC
jgi:hypothetical protein